MQLLLTLWDGARDRAPRSLLLASAVGLAAAPGLAQYAQVPAFLNGSLGDSENGAFGDVDLDGDWDLAIADGGDSGNQPNQLQINQGGLQGGAQGLFMNEAATRLPNQFDDSRDVEFADIDGDGDLDLHVVNTAQNSNQSNRWWINQGGDQGGALGFYADDTAARWVGLGGPGSSLADILVLPTGGFINWNEDADFADLDNDGDLDLVNSSYGGAYGGQVPTRLFLNDGQGYFTEYNPSGFKLPSVNIVNGQPALWAEGAQQGSTIDTTGLQSDIASAVTDLEVGDLDGDFDLDLILGDRSGDARAFDNRLGDLGQPTFRDVSNAVFPPNWSPGAFSQYDQELLDLDGDGDLDLYGLDWSGFLDRTFENVGGTFVVLQDPVPGSGNNEQDEVDAVDFDNDGDLDAFTASIAGPDLLFENDGSGLLSAVPDPGFLAGAGSKDGEVADVDGDGDYDIFVAESSNANNRLYANLTQAPDVNAPYIPAVEGLSNADAVAQSRVQRAQVYDNAPSYLTWSNATEVAVEVDGIDLGTFAAESSGGQVFRAELPGNLLGQVRAVWRSSDPYGNVGESAPVDWASLGGAATVPQSYGVGSPSSGGAAPLLRALSVPFVGSTLYLVGEGAPLTPALLVVTDQSLPPTPVPGLGTLNVAGGVLLLFQGATDTDGRFLVDIELPGSLTPGGVAFAQFGTFDGAGGALLATSQGLQVLLQ